MFVRLLEASKKYQNDLNVEVEDFGSLSGYRELLNGDCIAVWDIIAERMHFARIKQLPGERYNRTGIPLGGGSGQLVADRQISDIITEEAAGFFDGDQSAEHVAGVIQRRVQLYLNER